MESKRHITKTLVISILEESNIEQLIRKIKLEKLLYAEAVIMDSWSSNFYDDFMSEGFNSHALIDIYSISDSDVVLGITQALNIQVHPLLMGYEDYLKSARDCCKQTLIDSFN
jgi:hypothetical protein